MTPGEHATAIEDAAFAYGAACHVHGQEALAGALKNAIEAKKLLSAAIRAGVGAVPAPPDVVAELEEVKTVCAQAYQVMGVLLSEAGRLDSPEAKKILDNLAEQRLRHTDVLPWAAQAVPQGWQDSVTVLVRRGNKSVQQSFTDIALRQEVDCKAQIGSAVGLMIDILAATPKPTDSAPL